MHGRTDGWMNGWTHRCDGWNSGLDCGENWSEYCSKNYSKNHGEIVVKVAWKIGVNSCSKNCGKNCNKNYSENCGKMCSEHCLWSKLCNSAFALLIFEYLVTLKLYVFWHIVLKKVRGSYYHWLHPPKWKMKTIYCKQRNVKPFVADIISHSIMSGLLKVN